MTPFTKRLLSAVTVAGLLGVQPLGAAEKNEPAPATKPAAAAKQVDVEAFDKARQEQNAVVIDVRGPDEFAAGHIPGAGNVPVTGKAAADFDKKVSALAKDKKVLVHCRSGVRSAQAVERMRRMGIADIVEMPKGFVAWSEAGKPVQKGSGGEKPGK